MDCDNEERYLYFGTCVTLSNKGGIMAVGSPDYNRVRINSGLVQVFIFSTSKNYSQ